jgi:adenylate cyclase
MSGDPEQDYFSDGISEDIITDLSKIAGLTVIARNSSFTYKGRSVDVRTIGRELGVQSVLEGSIRRSGNRVRITAQLIDATSGGHLWADRYDRDLTDIFEVQDDVTRRIVNALKVTLSPGEKERLADTKTSNLAAYDYLLRGREFMLGKEKNRETFEQATTYFKKALEHDPNYSQAYVCLGFAHIFDYQNRWTDDPDGALPLAKQYARQALENDPNEPLARCVSAMTASFEKDLDRAKSEIDLALSLNPNLALAHNLRGSNRTYSGQPLEAIPEIEQAMRLDPALSSQFLHSSVWRICLQESMKQRPLCSGSELRSCPGRIFLALFSLLLLVISASSRRRAGYGGSLKKSTPTMHLLNTSAGSPLGGRKTSSALRTVSGRQGYRTPGRSDASTAGG